MRFNTHFIFFNWLFPKSPDNSRVAIFARTITTAVYLIISLLTSKACYEMLLGKYAEKMVELRVNSATPVCLGQREGK